MAIVSTIIPIYKVPERYLRQCIESLINQTLKDIEIILVDDGSPDDCGQICDEYAEKDQRIRVIHQKNKGLSGARNTGAKAATGQWLTMVDGDDWLEKECLEQAVSNAEKNDVEIVIWGTVKDFGKRVVPYCYDGYLEDKKIYRGEECKYVRELLLHYNAQIATAYAKLIKRSFIEEYQLYHNEVLRQGSEGLEFCMRLLENAQKILFLNQHWYHYIYNADSISARTSEANNQLILRCFESIRETIKDDIALMNWFYNRLLYVIITTAISGYFHPQNKEPYKIKKQKYIAFLAQPMIAEALKTNHIKEMSKQRLLIIWLIRHKMFLPIALLAKVRYRQKIK